MTDKAATVLVYRIVIKATPRRSGIDHEAQSTERYAYGGRVHYELKGRRTLSPRSQSRDEIVRAARQCHSRRSDRERSAAQTVQHGIRSSRRK